MANNIINQVAFLRTSREFPEEIHQLAQETNKSYLDTAAAVNDRIIGFFTVNKPSITGESYFLTGNQKQQTIRQVFTFKSTASINHGIQVVDINQFTRCWGQYTDSTGTKSYGLVWGTSTSTAGLITFYLTSTQIVFVGGAGAPALASGKIVLEWLSQP